MQKEGVIKGRDDAGVYKRVKGRDGAEGGHYKREG